MYGFRDYAWVGDTSHGLRRAPRPCVASGSLRPSDGRNPPWWKAASAAHQVVAHSFLPFQLSVRLSAVHQPARAPVLSRVTLRPRSPETFAVGSRCVMRAAVVTSHVRGSVCPGA